MGFFSEVFITLYPKMKKIFLSVIGSLFTGMLIILSSCSNDLDEIKKLTVVDTLPQQQATDVVMKYTEYGNLIFKLTSPKVMLFTDEKARTVFPDGLKIEFYDSTGTSVKTKLTAYYGIKYDDEKQMIARYDVVVNNYEKNERLNTEELVWDEKTKKIFTDKFVTITTDDQVLYGEEGMEADESFEQWIIKKPTGQLKIEDEEL
jgi:LPS export ABC transporter protein LptC